MRRPPPAALVVSPSTEDRSILQAVFHRCGWHLDEALTCGQAAALLRADNPPVIVVAVTDLPDGNWRELLELGNSLRQPPLVIVSSYFADDHLWAEALNLGAYDVLAMPFCEREVRHSVGMAWRQSEGTRKNLPTLPCLCPPLSIVRAGLYGLNVTRGAAA